MRGVIYKYTSPSGKVYIGQTCRERKRKLEFLTHKRYTRGSFIEEARKKYGPENFKYEVLFEIESDSKEDIVKALDYWEEYYISEFKSTDRQFGYNMMKGSTCNVGIVLSKESRERMGEKARERMTRHNPMKGKKFSPTQLARLKASLRPRYGKDNHNYGKPMLPELKERLREISKQRRGEKNTFYGRHHTQEVKDFLSEKFGRPVVQINAKTLEEINTYPSATAAAIEALGNKKRVVEICKVCNRYVRPNGIQSVSAGGYGWRWADEEYVYVEAKVPPPPSFKGQHLTQEMKDNISRINSKAVCQLEPDTLEVIAVHKSCQAAADFFNHPCSNSDIGKACNGKHKSGKVLGFRWKWLNQ